MGLGSSATPTQFLLLGELVVTALVVLGVRAIRHDRVHRHRLLMISALVANLVILAGFVTIDMIRASNTVERGLKAPLLVFLPLLSIHLLIAITALTLAVISWRIARRGVVWDPQHRAVALEPEVRRRHRRVSRFYPGLWYCTLASGILLYVVLYVVDWPTT